MMRKAISIDEADFHPLTTISAPENSQSVQIIDPEFSTVCPKSNLPDYGRVIIKYHPNEVIVELKALKLYLRDHYGVGIMHEAVTDRLINTFVEVVKPQWVQIVIDWGARGGLKTVTGVEWTSLNGYQHVDFDHETFSEAATNWGNT